MIAVNYFKSYFKQHQLTRFSLVILGTIVTWGLLINLLQVNFDLNDLSLSNNTRDLNTISSANVRTLPARITAPIPATVTPAVTSPVDEDTIVESNPLLSSTEAVETNPIETKITKAPPPPQSLTHTIPIHRHDNMYRIFKRLGLPYSTLKQIREQPLYYNYVHGFVVGRKLEITEKNHQLLQLVYPLDGKSELLIKHKRDGFREQLEFHGLTDSLAEVNTTIHGSLSASAHRAGLSTATVANLENIFKPKIDLSQNLSHGDHLKVLYIKAYKNGHYQNTGTILAAQVITGNKVYSAFRSPGYGNYGHYYNANGASLETSFMRTPLSVYRVTSPFNLHRMQPILHIIRPHYGVDLGAPSGTPVRATSAGVVKYEGRMGGYGNIIELQNTQIFSTRFGHLRSFARGLRVGEHVKQGQVIGYVGETGLATAPHLHYEFRINGKAVNPMTVKLPEATPLAHSLKLAFINYTRTVEAEYHFLRKA